MDDKKRQEIIQAIRERLEKANLIKPKVEVPEVPDYMEIGGVKLPFKKIPLPDKLDKALGDFEKGLESIYKVPYEQFSKGINQLETNPIAGATNIALGTLNTGFALTGIPHILTTIRGVIQAGLGEDWAKGFDDIMNLPATISQGLYSGIKEVAGLNEVKDKQKSFINSALKALLIANPDKFKIIAPLLTDKGQQELDEALNEAIGTAANIAVYSGLGKAALKLKPKKANISEAPIEPQPKPETSGIQEKPLPKPEDVEIPKPAPKPDEPIIRVIENKNGRRIYYDDTNKRFLKKEEIENYKAQYEEPVIIEKTVEGRRQYYNLQENRVATNEEVEQYRAGKFQKKKQIPAQPTTNIPPEQQEQTIRTNLQQEQVIPERTQEQPPREQPVDIRNQQQSSIDQRQIPQPITNIEKPTTTQTETKSEQPPTQNIKSSAEESVPAQQQEIKPPTTPKTQTQTQKQETQPPSPKQEIKPETAENKPKEIKPTPLGGETDTTTELKIQKAEQVVTQTFKTPATQPEPKTFKEKVQQASQKSYEEITQEYQELAKRRANVLFRAQDAASKIASSIWQASKNTFTVLSQKAKDINIDFFRYMRRYEYDNLVMINRISSIYRQFEKKVRQLPKNTQAAFEAALDNAKFFDNAVDIAKKNGFYDEFMNVIKVRDALAEALDIKLEKGHWDRMVKDYQGFLKDFYERFPDLKQPIEKMLSEAIQKKGRMTEQEQANYIANAFRGLNPRFNPIRLSDIPGAKERIIPVLDGEFKKYYFDSVSAGMLGLLEKAQSVMERKFFGKNGFDWQEAIGNYLINLSKEGKLTGKYPFLVKELLQARFSPKDPRNSFLKLLHQSGVLFYLGNFKTALTQFKDLAYSLDVSIPQTFKSMGDILLKDTVRQLMGKNRTTFRLRDIEIPTENIYHIFLDFGYRARTVETALKLNGFWYYDIFGKNTLINTLVNKYHKLAVKNELIDHPRFGAKLKEYFGSEEKIKSVVEDLKKKKMTPDIAYLLFNELSDRHPLTPLEHSQTYMMSGNARIAFFLRTFTIKQFNFVMNETVRNLVRGYKEKNPAAFKLGLKRLFTLVPILTATGGTVDYFKDKLSEALTGKKPDFTLPDQMVDNLLGLILLSRYDKDLLEGKGADALRKKLLPIDPQVDITVDMINLLTARNKTIKSMQYIPFIGRFMWDAYKNHIYKDYPQGEFKPNQELLKPYEQFQPF